MKSLPGTIYKNSGRYWWRVRLPGEKKRRAIALKPPGARFATTDRRLAQKLAREIWQKHEHLAEAEVKTVADLAAAYLQHCRDYYHDEDSTKGEYATSERALNRLVEVCGDKLADDITPSDIRKATTAMIEAGYCRTTINKNGSSPV